VYAIEYPDALETYGGNTQRILAFAKNLNTEDTSLIGSDDGGTTWTVQNGTYAGQWVRFVDPALRGTGSEAWLAGINGIGYTPDFGITVEDKTGNFNTVTGSTPASGVFPL
jgi:hypothetical protein